MQLLIKVLSNTQNFRNEIQFLAEEQAVVEGLMTALAALEVGNDLTAMTQVAASISSASENPERLSTKSIEAGIDFANKLASSISNSHEASLDQISDIGTSLLGSVGGAMVSTAKSTSSNGNTGSHPEEGDADEDGENLKEVNSEDKAKLKDQANKLTNTMFNLGAAILDKKVPGTDPNQVLV